MRRVGMILVGLLALLMARPADAVCKLVINVDRTASMMAVRDNGKTRCETSQEQVLAILDAYLKGLDFDITHPERGAIPRAEYTANCPAGPDYMATAGTRLVQVREFHGDVMSPVVSAGFLPVSYVITQVVKLNWYDSATGRSRNNCPGPSTPLAQAMCRAARIFPPTPPPPDEFRIVKTTTDGQENSSTYVPVANGETRCRINGEPELEWRQRVMNEYTTRDIAADAVLWGVGGSTSLQEPSIAAREPDAEAHGYTERFGSLDESPDYLFFWSMALSTGGLFNFVDEATALSPVVTLIDSDSDGIPDFRDQCVGTCASDADRDGIPDANDLCPSLAEDGRIPNSADGCPDSDSDGAHNGVDLCPNALEDSLEPFPNDNCPAERWSATSTLGLQTINNATVCTHLNVNSRTGAASLAKLDISGDHQNGFWLRGTLMHNGTTVMAFPAGTFSPNPTGGPGRFQFFNRQMAMPPGAASGTWTLCLTDSNPYGYIGILWNWSVHD